MKYNKDLSGIAIVDELIRRTSSASLRLARDTIVGSSVVVRTAPTGGGTLLALTTDYTLGGQDARLTTEAGTDIFTTLAIVNGAYHNTDLYVTYSTVGDFAEAEDINELSGSVTVAGNYSVQTEHTVNVNANSATITIPAGLRIGRRITVRKLGTVETTSVDIARSGSEVFTSASLTSLPIFGNGGNWIIEKVTATRWEIVGGWETVFVSGRGWWQKDADGTLTQWWAVAPATNDNFGTVYDFPIQFYSVQSIIGSPNLFVSSGLGGSYVVEIKYESVAQYRAKVLNHTATSISNATNIQIAWNAKGRWY